MSEAQAVTLAKRILRGALRSRLKEVASDELDAPLSKKACAGMQVQHWFSSSRSVSVFLSMPMAEIRTDDILSALMMSGKRASFRRLQEWNALECLLLTSILTKL